MLKDLKIGTRLGAAISLIVIILVTVIVIGSANLGHYAKASGWNTHTYQVLEQGQTILTSLINIETGQRGFLIAGKDEFLEPLNKGKQNFDIAFDTIKDLTSDNPKQQERLSKLKNNYELFIKNAIETSINKR